MPIPIICLDTHLRHFAERFRHELSKPQYQHFVIVRLRLMLCEGTRTLRRRARAQPEARAPKPRRFLSGNAVCD